MLAGRLSRRLLRWLRRGLGRTRGRPAGTRAACRGAQRGRPADRRLPVARADPFARPPGHLPQRAPTGPHHAGRLPDPRRRVRFPRPRQLSDRPQGVAGPGHGRQRRSAEQRGRGLFEGTGHRAGLRHGRAVVQEGGGPGLRSRQDQPGLSLRRRPGRAAGHGDGAEPLPRSVGHPGRVAVRVERRSAVQGQGRTDQRPAAAGAERAGEFGRAARAGQATAAATVRAPSRARGFAAPAEGNRRSNGRRPGTSRTSASPACWRTSC